MNQVDFYNQTWTNSVVSPEAHTSETVKSDEDAFPDSPLKLSRAMHPVLMSIFLDSAPSAFHSELHSRGITTTGNKAPSIHLELIWCISSILCDLWRASVISDLDIKTTDYKNLASIMEKMSTYFIFGADALDSKDVRVR